MATNFEYMHYCPKCGAIGRGAVDGICEDCKIPVVYTELKSETFFEMEDSEYEDWKKKIHNQYIKTNPLFDGSAENKRLAEEERDRNEYHAPKPKCPTCGSTSLSRVNGSATGWVGAFGTISMNSNAGKTFCCNNCGYKW